MGTQLTYERNIVTILTPRART